MRGIGATLVLVGLLAGCGVPSGTPGASPTGTRAPSEPAQEPSAAPSASTVPGTPGTTAPSTAAPSTPTPSSAVPSVDPSMPVTIGLQPFVSGLESPVALTHAGDGSGDLYVVEQAGRIRVIEADGTLRPDPLLDIDPRVVSGGEQGLLGLAFHPAFAENGRFFVMYTAEPEGANTVSEFRVVDGTVDAGAERVLLAIPDFAPNHNGGMVAFGSDGMLYVGTGDGGGGGDPEETGQDPSALLGKILRLDVDGGDPYGIPADNPFAGGGGAPEVWALGLRNPWRFSFDRVTGDLWIGDVGQGRWEEVDVLPVGAEGGTNLGWDVMEGPACYEPQECDTAGLTPPVAAYSHDEGCTIIGGSVYRGEAEAALQGRYVYGDYCSGLLWTLDAAAALRDGTAQPLAAGQVSVPLSAWGEDEAGELYAVDLDGTIHRVRVGAP